MGYRPRYESIHTLDNIRPVANITLSVRVVPHGHHGAVGLKPHGVRDSCGNLDEDSLKLYTAVVN